MKQFFPFGRLAVTLLLLLSYGSSHSQTNNAVTFDGVDDYINIADNNAIDLSSNFTLEVWIKPSGVGSQPTEGGMIINKENSYEVARFADGSIRFALSANGAGNDWAWTNTGIVAPLNQWSHIAIVKSGTSVTPYMNGMALAVIGSQPATLVGNAQSLRIGARTNITHNFNGSVDEVRIWNTARTAEQLKTQMFTKTIQPNAGGLVAYYRMNETSGTASANTCTNYAGIDGVMTNGPVRNASPVQFSGNSLSFDGVNDHVVSAATFNMNMNNSSIAVEAWVNSANSSANTTTERILLQWGNTWQAGSFKLACTDTYINFNFYGSSTTSCTYTANWQDGNWHHVAGVFNVSTHMLYLYFDGVQRAAVSTGTNAPGSLSGSLYIGGSPSVANSFVSAKIDEVRVWNTPRSQVQIQANMNTELSHPYFNSSSVPRLYYTFNQGSAGGTNTGITTVTEQYLEAHGNGSMVNFAMTGTSSNFTQQYSGMSVLPLKWLGFTAQKQSNGVQLEWSTTLEFNTKDFVIEHKSESGNWKGIFTFPVSTIANSTMKYNYNHAEATPGLNYYRIRQNDADGKYSYSDIRTVLIRNQVKPVQLIQDGSSGKVLHIQVNQSEGIPVSFLNTEGRLIWRKKLTKGLHTIDVNSISSGVYYLTASTFSERILIR